MDKVNKEEYDETVFIHSEWTIHDEREMNKIGLETFIINMENRLDGPLETAIKKLREERINIEQRITHTREVNYITECPSDECIEQENINKEIDTMNSEWELLYNEEELYAFFEVKIMYAQKHLEINIKRLITVAYNYSNTKSFFRWESLIDFFKEKGIDIKKLNGYKEVNQLREVSNFIKHDDNLDISLRHINEFKKNNTSNSARLEKFYQRIKSFPKEFLNSLMSAIYDQLYTFSEDRIAKMARDIMLRMDKKDIDKLIKALMDK
jgi:hypothetical protein